MQLNLSDNEKKSWNDFVEIHSECKGKDGLSLDLRFRSGAGIGIAVYAYCNNCKKYKNITDYGIW